MMDKKDILEGEDRFTAAELQDPFKTAAAESDAKDVRHAIDLEKAKKNIARAKSYWDTKHAKFQQMIDFVHSDDLKDSWGARVDPNRVQAHFKLVKRYINKLMEGVRQNSPGIKLTPVNGGGDNPLAGVVRYIENRSQARIAYPKALEQALICGLGWLKIVHTEKGNMPIKIKIVRDVSSAFFDPESLEVDGSDGEFCFLTSKKKDEEGKNKEVIQYYEMHEERCWWAHIEGGEITDQGQFILNGLPLIPVYGEFYVKDGEKVFTGFGLDLKSVNQFFDYTVSTSLETVAAQTKDPLFAFKGQVDMKQVADAATKPIPIIEIEKADLAGEAYPGTPFRIPRQFNLEWLTATTDIFNRLFGDITGISDQNFGVDGANIQSGYAIEMRQKTNVNLLHSEYIDNLYASISYLGQMLADYAALAAGTGKTYMAMHPDGTVIRHEAVIEKDGKTYRTSFDTDDVEIYGSVGKSYLNKNQEFIDKFRELLPTMPAETASLYMDVFWKSLDMPYSDILAQRAYSMLPTAARTDGTVSMKEFEALQQQLQQLQQENAKLMDQERIKGQNALATAQVNQQTAIAKIEAQSAADMNMKMVERDIDKEKDERDYEQDANIEMIKGEYRTAQDGHQIEADAAARIQEAQKEVVKDARKNQLESEKLNTNAGIEMAKIRKDLTVATGKIASDNAAKTAQLAQDLDFKKADMALKAGGANA